MKKPLSKVKAVSAGMWLNRDGTMEWSNVTPARLNKLMKQVQEQAKLKWIKVTITPRESKVTRKGKKK